MSEGARKLKICLVSSCGGHLTELRLLRPAYEKFSHFYVLNDRADLLPDMESRTVFITHSERDWKFFLNLWEAWSILRREKPDLILSTGAGLLVPFALVGRFFFGTRIIFVELTASVHFPSLTGRIMRFLAHHSFYQWPYLARFFPKGHYEGSLL